MTLGVTARVRVPATSANLGSGFDALGLALGLHDEVTARRIPAGLEIVASGEGSASIPRDETHLIVRAMQRTFVQLGAAPTGLALSCVNRIPHGRGLGSSAAAVVAGILLARALVPGGAAAMDDGDALALANDIEGHPDNVAPCLLGGLTIAWRAAGRAHALRRDLDASIVPVVLVPSFASSTEMARGLLPSTVPHADAAFSAGRAALLVAALTGSPQALLAATEDRLHQAYRAPAYAESLRLLETLRADGHAAVISGAGPTVLVLARGHHEVEQVLTRVPAEWAGRELSVDLRGATVDTGPTPD